METIRPTDYRVLLGFTRFFWVLLGFTGFHRVLLGFTRFFLVFLGFTGFYRVLPGFPPKLLLGAFAGAFLPNWTEHWDGVAKFGIFSYRISTNRPLFTEFFIPRNVSLVSLSSYLGMKNFYFLFPIKSTQDIAIRSFWWSSLTDFD